MRLLSALALIGARLGRLAAAGAAFALAAPSAVQAQTDPAAGWPRQPVKIVVGLAAGAVNDIQTRVIAAKLAERLGQPVVVENRPGAGGIIAAEHVARAAPDGYTLYNAPTSTITVSPAVYSKLAYSPPRDFVSITQISVYPLYLAVDATLPVRTVDELLAYAKANPDKANLGTPGTFFDMMAAMLTLKSGVPFVSIPFRSVPETVTAVLTGQALIAYVDFNSAGAQFKAGKLRALAATSAKRTADLPDVPSIAEAGFPDAVAEPISGIVAPKRTPMPIVKRLETEINAVLRLPDVRERWKQMGLDTVESSSEAFDKLIASDIQRWTAVAKAANIKLD